MKTAILIPAYKPDQKFLPFVKSLVGRTGGNVIVVNDGSGEAYFSVFEEVKKIPGIIFLNHPINLGKGGALKTGFHYILERREIYKGVVTADADGQHRVEDILNVASALEANSGSLIMGARAFSGEVPLRSKFGNILTRLLFKKFFHIKISDTQTGLRGIQTFMLPAFIAIPFNHYEYETEMLLVSSRKKFPLLEVSIETVYENNNASSHFNPLTDSMKIYFVLLRYTLISLFSALVDFIVFVSVYPLIGNILLSTYAARCVSLCVNYGLVSRKVFFTGDKMSRTFPKYLLLVIISGFLSSLIITTLHNRLSIPVTLAKVLSESILYVMNFFVQKHLIFKEKQSTCSS